MRCANEGVEKGEKGKETANVRICSAPRSWVTQRLGIGSGEPCSIRQICRTGWQKREAGTSGQYQVDGLWK